MLEQRSWDDSKPVKLKASLDPAWTKQFPLRTKGRYIVTSTGSRFRLKAINWYGASDASHVVGGLDVQNLDVICTTVVDMGFNAIRLPFSNEMLRTKLLPEGSVNYGKNPKLSGLNALQVFDEVVRALGRHRIVVILNNHTTYGEFCGPPSKNSLWFDPGGLFSEDNWMADWVMMARRYSTFPHVCGYDLRNEIRPRLGLTPYFGHGTTWRKWSGRCNWARAARALAFDLLAVQAAQLIIVERIVWPQKELDLYAANPGPLLPDLDGHLVLGVHMYHWSGPGRFVPPWSIPPRLSCFFGVLSALGIVSKNTYGTMKRPSLKSQIDREWGNILKNNTCPVWVSEFGADMLNEEEMKWMRDFVHIAAELNADWAYWPLNVGPKSGAGTGDILTDGEELYGMLNIDWTPRSCSEDPRIALLCKIGLSPKGGEGESRMRNESLNDEELLWPLQKFSRRRSQPMQDHNPLSGMTSAPDFTVLHEMMKTTSTRHSLRSGLGLGMRRISSARAASNCNLADAAAYRPGVPLSSTVPCLQTLAKCAEAE